MIITTSGRARVGKWNTRSRAVGHGVGLERVCPARLRVPGDRQTASTVVPREERSRHEGRRVCLSRDSGRYFGAQPYYTVSYFRLDGRKVQVARYPLTLERANHLFGLIVHDVIDPEALAQRPKPQPYVRKEDPTVPHRLPGRGGHAWPLSYVAGRERLLYQQR
jgi:hypothetical protein